MMLFFENKEEGYETIWNYIGDTPLNEEKFIPREENSIKIRIKVRNKAVKTEDNNY